MFKQFCILLLFSMLVLTAQNAEEELTENSNEQSTPKSFWEQERLTGDWGGIRSGLEDQGITFNAAYTLEIFGSVTGGTEREAENIHNLDLQLTLDFEKIAGWSGTTLFAYVIAYAGGDISKNVDAIQVVSAIEDDNSTVQLYEFWLEKNFGNVFSIKIGLYDLNSEFDTVPVQTAATFLNSSHGMGTELASSGVNGPSTFPATSFGARFRFTPVENFYWQVAVVDGVPGDPNDGNGTHIIWKRDDGLLLATEAGYTYGNPENPYWGKIAIGIWYYTGLFDDVKDVDENGDPEKRRGSSGIYTYIEQSLFREDDSSDQGLMFFARVGIADEQVNQFYLYTGAGLVYTGLIPGREQDKLGISIAVAHNGEDFKDGQDAQGVEVEDEETVFEVVYSLQLTEFLQIRPDFQYIKNPSTDPDKKNASVLGVRFSLTF